jgi:hypothetical protein
MWGGLLLGWAREGRPLGHDLFDADFGFCIEDKEHFAEGAHALMAAGFEPHFRFRNNAAEVTEWVFLRNEARFEFFALRRHDGMLRYHIHSLAALHDFSRAGAHQGQPVQGIGEIQDQPVEEIRFLGRIWRKHLDHESELVELYGDWRTPDPEWWYMDSPSIIHLEPWRYPEQSWDGSLGEALAV